jgi:hypothetical protein
MLDPDVTPPSLLKQAIKAVPAVKYALGVAGIIAVIAIVRGGLNIDFRVAVFGTVIMLVLMTILVVFANLASQQKSSFRKPAIVFTWFSLLLVMATAALLFLSVFFGKPLDLRNLIPVSHAQSVPSSESPPQTAETKPLTTNLFSSVSTIEPLKGRLTSTERKAHTEEFLGDLYAFKAIETEVCDRGDCSPKSAKFSDPSRSIFSQSEETANWKTAMKHWQLSLDATHDQQRIDRILEKRKLDSGLTCRDAPGAHSRILLEHCEVNTAQIDCLQLQGLFGYYEIYRPLGIGH